jgi:hypothetical protein
MKASKQARKKERKKERIKKQTNKKRNEIPSSFVTINRNNLPLVQLPSTHFFPSIPEQSSSFVQTPVLSIEIIKRKL